MIASPLNLLGDTMREWFRDHVKDSGYLAEVDKPENVEANVIALAEASYLLNQTGVAHLFRAMTYEQIKNFMPRDEVQKGTAIGQAVDQVWGQIKLSRNNLMAHAVIQVAAQVEYIIANGYPKYLEEKYGGAQSISSAPPAPSCAPAATR
jgi:hypothetical protein